MFVYFFLYGLKFQTAFECTSRLEPLTPETCSDSYNGYVINLWFLSVLNQQWGDVGSSKVMAMELSSDRAKCRKDKFR